MNINRLVTVFIWLAGSSGVVIAQPSVDLKGFEPGTSFEKAQEHARKANLHLREIASLPGNWTVGGTKVTLFVCSGMVARADVEIEGGLDEFGDLVSSLTWKFGSPELRVVSFDMGAIHVTNIDARFAANQQAPHGVQLHSYDGELGISASVGSTIQCPPVVP